MQKLQIIRTNLLLNIIPCAAALTFLIVANVGAEIYKWVDEEGNVNYSQHPPQGGGEISTIKPPPKVDTEAAVKQLEDQRKAFSDQKEEKAKQDKETQKGAEQIALRESNCQKARAKYDNVVNTRRVRALDEYGNVTRVTDEEHQRRIADAAAKIAKWCD
jgi:hypothetical protein